jgi:hypothetical protein
MRVIARYQALPGNADPEALPLFTSQLREREMWQILNYKILLPNFKLLITQAFNLFARASF